MSRQQKLLSRLQSKPKDFTWSEAVALMESFDFYLLKSSGSSRKFVHKTTKVKVLIHEPHPEKIVKAYAMQNLIDGLTNAGEIN